MDVPHYLTYFYFYDALPNLRSKLNQKDKNFETFFFASVNLHNNSAFFSRKLPSQKEYYQNKTKNYV